ncbi:hybrid sensor histidine kinase/response regulator transcription factor [Dysgonomonas macrotermitis]|uniref:histidine kinase n=1 Tax=Dysgonomonas macrotermitis TaxID=1346286 RepID=A0A1M4VPA9_9BACT|nr:hybrid sensor histidine kinase/response regulator transcription factor [Dysgonomonas macrotermitis]SHE70715.1 Signal transduction histidine kinase [Dysgonomonas macrotermitis]
MKCFSYFLLYFFSLFPVLALGQSSYAFHHLSTNDGLSNNHVKSILKDSYGFLWVGTQSGLNRYDGYRFKYYMSSQDTTNSLIGDDIKDLQEDKKGNIWIGSENKYVMYDRTKDHFVTNIHELYETKGIKAGSVNKVYIDKSKNLWVKHQDTIDYYQFDKNQLRSFICPIKDEVNINDDGISLYMVSGAGILYNLDIQKGTWNEEILPHNISQQIKDSDNKLYIDEENGLWLSSGLYLFHKDSKQKLWKEIILQSGTTRSQQLISSILDAGNGKIWITTDHKELIIYDKQNNKQTLLVNDPWIRSSILPGSIEALYKDSLGTIWMGSNKGLSFYHESLQNFFNFRNEEFRDISSILEDRQGNIWLGTDGYGLIRKKDYQSNLYEKINLPASSIVTLFEDSKGRVWMGSYQKGLFCYENGKIKQFTKENSNLSDNSVWSITEDRYGYIWIGTLWGTLQRLDTNTYEFENHFAEYGDNLAVMDMYYDGGDKLYAGTVYGICLIDILSGKKTIFHGNAKGTQKYRQMFIQSLYKDKRDILWIGHNQGLTAWDIKADTLYYFDKSNGLCDNVIRGISEDALDHIWITTSNGCSVLTITKDEDGILKCGISNFSTKDGLMSNDFNRHSIFRLKNGDMLLGEAEGYSLVNPNKMSEKRQPLAKVIFTGLKIGNEEIKTDLPYDGRVILNGPIEQISGIKLKYSDILITLEYTTMDLLTANKVRYAYQLENFNQQWIYTSDNKITFTSLSPGRYKLLIKACNSDGIWSDEITTLDIEVKPPFWMSWYAYIFYFILVVGVIGLILKSYHKKQKNKLEQQRLHLEHNQMIRINEMKLKFFTNVSHDFRTPLTLIITPLQVMIEEYKDQEIVKKLRAVYRSAEQMLNLVNELLDFRKLDVGAEKLRPTQSDFVSLVKETALTFKMYASERQMHFNIIDEAGHIYMSFDVDKVRKIISNLLSNAFKYTQDRGSIIVRIYKQDAYINVSVSDTGNGVSDEDKKFIFERFYQAGQNIENTGSGIGLHIVNEYVRLHNGSLNVGDNSPHGSIFTISIPIVDQEIKDSNLPEEMLSDDENTSENEMAIKNDRPVLLLVEDNKDFQEFMSESLSDEFDVLVAGNGQEALECLTQNDINFVISDVMMPVMDGIELCKKIKTNIEWSHIPVILLTARTAEEYKIQGLEYGADDYITKPFNYNLLRLRIRKFMEWTEKSHQAFNQKIDISPSEITITSLDEQLISKAIKVVENHMDDPELSVEVLSSAVGLTRGHLYKKLTHITGKGPSEFIRTIRLKRAKQLLDESQMQISEIAYAVGFNSPKIFTRYFKTEFGISPSEYIRRQK